MRRLFGIGKRGGSTSSSLEVMVDAENKLGLLREADIFGGLDDEQMQQVEKMTVMSHCRRGRLIYAPEETPEALFLLKKGKVNVYQLTPDGRKLITAVITPGTLFGNMAFTGSRLGDSFAEALEDSVLCVMSRADLEHLITMYPVIGIRLLDILGNRARELEERLAEGLLRDMQARVAAALLRLSDRQGSNEIRITHQELADNLGTYRETVTLTLGGLQTRGLVTLERGLICILDAAGLREIIDSDSGRRGDHG
jgi:CRP/FNR family transcriptional regulator, cyclic AMP receptor protein